jgi:hypothetical protein
VEESFNNLLLDRHREVFGESFIERKSYRERFTKKGDDHHSM